MRVDTISVGLAAGIGSAIFWTVCSILVALAPGPSLSVTRDLFHVVSGSPAWGVTRRGYFVGLCGWGVATGVFAWLCASLYNRMVSPDRALVARIIDRERLHVGE